MQGTGGRESAEVRELDLREELGPKEPSKMKKQEEKEEKRRCRLVKPVDVSCIGL